MIDIKKRISAATNIANILKFSNGSVDAGAEVNPKNQRPLLQYWLVFLLAIGALVALAFIWHALQDRRHDGVREVFANEARRITTKIDERLGAYGQILRSGAGLFASNNAFDRKGWAAFVEKLDLDQNYRGVQGVGYSKRIAKKDLQAHLDEMHRQGFSDYVVKPNGERDEYTSIIYLVPFSGRNLRAFGYDMYSEPTRNAAMSLARDVGDVAFSGKVKLLQETKNDVQAGILAYFPVYRNNTITQTQDQRRESIIGWIYSPYRMNDMMIPIVAKELDAIRLEIFDGETLNDESLLFDSEFGNNGSQAVMADSNALISIRKLELPGRYWTLRFTALPGFAQAQRFSSPIIESATLATIGILVVGMAAAFVGTGRRARAIAEQLTSALRQSEQRYSALFAKSRVPMLLIDPMGGQILEGNAAAEAFYGYGAEQLKALNIGQINTLTSEQIAAEMQLAASEMRSHFEFAHRLADGSVRDVEVHSGPIDVNGRHLLYSIVHDVTKRRQIEAERERLSQRLSDQERHWATLIETTPVGVFEADAEGKCLFVNQVWQQISGISATDALGDGWNNAIHPSDRKLVVDEWNACTLAKQPFKLEYRFMRPNGEARWVIGSAHRLVSDSGQTTGFIGSITDITERKRMEDAVAELNRNFVSFLENTGDFIYFKDSESRFRFCSQTLARITGHQTWRDMLGKHDLEVFPPDTARIYYEEELPIFATGQPLLNKVDPYYDELGKKRWVSTNKWPLLGHDGKVDGIFGISRDITEMRAAQEHQKLAASVFHHSREGIVITDANGTMVDVNDAFTEITGYARSEAIGRKPSLLASGRHSAEFFTAMWRQLASKFIWEGEVWNRRKGGEVYAELLNISAVTDDTGGISHYVGIFTDITMRKDQEQRLEKMAHYDPLTTLPNRLLFDDRLRQAMAQAQRRAQQLAVLFIDLDGFKGVNDRFGHEAGDVLLVNVAYRLKDALRAGDSIARIGGDEFVAVLTDLNGFSDVEQLIDRLLVAASAPVHHGSHLMQVSASIGIAMFRPEESISVEELIQRADQAMYEAKNAGKNRYAMYGPANG